MFSKPENLKGFTLIEIAIVLIIVTILLGYSVAMVPVQQELKQYRQANVEMDRIIDALYAFAQVNGRLPCADNWAAPDGISDPPGSGDCTLNGWYGLLPAKTLGIEGKYDANNSLLDPWGTPYRYQVTSIDSALNGGDFVVNNDIQTVGMVGLAPDLVICTVNPTNNATDTACANAANTIANGVPAIVLSLGKDSGNIASNIQGENTDNTADGVTDIVFVKSTRSGVAGSEYDDLVKWISPNILYSKMIDAGQLP